MGPAMALIVVTSLLVAIFAPLSVALAFLAGNLVMGIAAIIIVETV